MCLCGSRCSSLESGTRLLSLDGGESLQLVLGHVDLLSTLELVGGSRDEVGSVGVERLVSRSSSGKSFSFGIDNGGGSSIGLSLLEVLDDGELHGYLTKSRGKYQTMFQTQTIPIHPPEMDWTLVKPQSPKAAMMEEINWARQKAIMRAYEGRSVHEGP